MKTVDIIERFKRSFGVNTQTALAKMLDLTPSSITDALRREEIPDVWLYKVAYRTGRRVEWLQSGQGPEFADAISKEKERYQRLSPALRCLIDQLSELSGAEQSIVGNAMKLLLSHDLETRSIMVTVVESVLKNHKSQPRKSASGSSGKSS